MWVAGVSGVSLDYPRNLSSASCDFVFRHLIQFLSPVGSTKDLKTTFESLYLSSDMYLTSMYRKGAVPFRTWDPQNEFLMQDHPEHILIQILLFWKPVK